MDDQSPSPNEPDWLDEFEELADDQLGDGSACEQVHPIVEQWYADALEQEPPESRDAVLQAMACLSTELIFDSPDGLMEALSEFVDEDELALWVQHIVMVGRAFQIALDKGDLDDL
jgi:hypothetical protein